MVVQALTMFFMAVTVPALAEPWGWAEGPSGRTPLEDASVPADATNVVFAAGTVAPGSLALSNRKLTFTAASEGTTLVVGGAQSGFDLSGTAGDWTFRGITFHGTGECADTVYDGGAICCAGGRLTLESCAFDKVCSRFTGGAVSAYLMDGDVSVSNCTFTGNASGPLNGMGGALYASRSATGTGTLRLRGSSFSANAAQNGGAVATVRVVDDDEKPMPIELDGCTFRGNSADYSGGAIDDEGDLCATNTLFAENVAALQGGAICAGTSDPEWAGSGLTVLAGTVFRGNSAENDVADDRYWTCGGAVAVVEAGFSLSVSGRHVVFDGNRAESASSSYGGAIATVEGTVVDVSCAAFLANRATSAGGAVCLWGDELGISTSIFSNNTVKAANGFGGSVSVLSGATLTLRNSTVRGSNGGAIDVYRASAQVVNCVVVDNGELDLAFTESSATLLRSACGAFSNVGVDGVGASLAAYSCNLTNRTAAIYAGDALRLRQSGFNEVAALGLPQDARDYDGVAYGSRPAGYSMGAYETPASGLFATVRGSRRYDGTTDAPADFEWSVADADGSPVDLSYLGGIANLFEVTGREFASCNAGSYGSTNELSAARILLDYSVRPGPYAFCADVISLVAEGEILPRPVTFQSADAEKEYDTLPLTTNAVAVTRQDEEGPDTGILNAEKGFLSFVVTGSRTEVGSSPNLFEVVWGDGIASGNYDVTVEYGTLTVTASRDPVVEVGAIKWYHNRSDGLFYPQISVSFIQGDASRIVRLTLRCAGTERELPATHLTTLRAAKAGDVFTFGVNPAKFVQYPDSPEGWGFVPPEDRLFGVYDATRALGFSMEVQGELTTDRQASKGDKGEKGSVLESDLSVQFESADQGTPACEWEEKLVQGVKLCRVLTDYPEPKIKASGLPKGLKIVATPVRERIGRSMKTVGHTCVLSGTPTKAGVYRAKFKQKSGSEMAVMEETFVVGALPTWAFGTFDGWVLSFCDGVEVLGAASMNVTSAGKISGKMSVLGKTWKFSATGFDAAPAEEDGAFVVMAEAKCGRLRKEVHIRVSPDWFSDCSHVELHGEDVIAGLRRSVWKDKPAQWRIAKTKFDLQNFGYPDVTVTVATSGKVKFSGKMPDGRRVSCASTAFVDENGEIHASLIVPPKNGISGFMLDVPIPGAEVQR